MEDYTKIFSLEGKKALITGGTGGLGSEVAAAFRQLGAQTAVCGRHAGEGCVPPAEYKNGEDDRSLFIRCDITDEADVKAMMDTIESVFGTLDIVVNCAGMNKLIAAENYDTATFEKVMKLNVTGTFLVNREAADRFLIPKHAGKIINFSSVKSFLGTDKDYIAYCTSKGAINMYTKQLACEWGKYGICVNAIAPTFVRTPINSFQLDDPVFYKSLTDRIPLGRIGMKKDIASAAIFLASEASDFVSGQVLAVDGGLTAKQ